MKKICPILLALLLLPTLALADVAQRIQAPAHVTETFQSNTGKTVIHIDADVYVPPVDAIPTYRVEPHIITEADVLRFGQAIAPDSVWKVTQSEVDSRGGYDPAYSSDSFVLAWYPQDDGTEGYDPQPGQLPADWDDYGRVSGFNSYYDYPNLNTKLTTNQVLEYDFQYAPGVNAYTFFYDSLSYLHPIEGDQLNKQPLTLAQARALAVAAAGRIDPAFEMRYEGGAEGELIRVNPRTKKIRQNMNYPERCYGFVFTRTVSGVPVNATSYRMEQVQEDTQFVSKPQYEMLCITVDQAYIIGATLNTPWDIGEQTAADCALAPFSQVLSAFGEIAPLSIQYTENETAVMGGRGNRWDITEIRLGYMPVLCKDDPTLWELRPVWDFIGTRILARETYDYPGNVALTIDAVTGQVIDRDYGY